MLSRTVVPLLIAVTLTPCARQEFEIPDTDGMRWFRGCTHTHTTMSDGDSSPEVVARWYKEHGYDFLVLSDHNVFTDPSPWRYSLDIEKRLVYTSLRLDACLFVGTGCTSAELSATPFDFTLLFILGETFWG